VRRRRRHDERVGVDRAAEEAVVRQPQVDGPDEGVGKGGFGGVVVVLCVGAGRTG
jgi:hypothetical protein